ncbi:unnamed protein product [Tilletia controversa]|uniref:Protein PBN1 n=3 Tax=Tilletia TaxID=13289 RepID=A0A8X7MSC0_9BASI|nr:hypothetical protein CF336_g2171 [Tilletia laevis]KAE8202719.1 hypothetical protein CF328_g2053 [Tilletia controversa]KAE8262506.1 hypothetical protein A4X03_0g2403 [Tilletia caries]KAE8207024.1 hypothetical protein CF335_g1451 [Tilletia laevis]KAE8247532.1 hypothetical protein A4X06_0g4382 [Tilletia controversa]
MSMSMSASLSGMPSLHPSIQVSLPASHLSPPAHCRPFLLQRLPPALFLDPYAFRIQNTVLAPPAHIRNITHLGLTELERAVGWTDPTGATRRADRFVRRLQRQRKRADEVKALGQGQGERVNPTEEDNKETESFDLDASLRALNLEHTAVLLELHPQAIKEEDPALAEKVFKAIKGEDVALEETSPSSRKKTVVSIPVHARYLPPLAVGKGGLADSGRGLDLGALREQVLRPNGSGGLYDDVLIDRPDFFWACEGEMTQQEAFKQDWSFVQPAELLPQPLYAHVSLTPPFPSFNPHNIRFLRPNPTDESRSPLVLRLPRGDASLGPLLQAVTFGVVLLATLAVMVQASRAVSVVRRVERGRRLKEE